MSKRHNTLPPIASFFMSIAEKTEDVGVGEFKIKVFFSSCLMAGDGHIKIIQQFLTKMLVRIFDIMSIY